MCGIVAIQGKTKPKLAREMMARIQHRGPDGEGVGRVGRTTLGHVRLAILDLAGGAQPMANETDDLLVAFNGEIYNHADLRRRLEAKHVFRTRSDTEVLLHLYEEKGADMLRELDGMFAIALASANGLLLARDPLGIKPLYYAYCGNNFLAASELKAFPPTDNIQMLPAGYAMLAGSRPWRFASPFPPEDNLYTPRIKDILPEIRQRLERAVVKRLMSDVPVGVYLSGGLDSSLIAAIMRPHVAHLHSFTAGMQGAPDLAAARDVASFLGTKHHELVYTAKDIVCAIPEVIRHLESFDAPLVRSALPMYFVSKLVAKYVKVVLSGEGADELFAGYAYLAQLGGGARLKQELAAMVVRLQDTNLQRADRMSMAHGLEARVPFLDTGFVRYLSRLPVEVLEPRANRPEKWLLREAFCGLLPPAILNRKKMKFSEGAGSADVMAKLVAETITTSAFERDRRISAKLVLRSPEELYYYRIWRKAMPAHISPDLVGRTLDPSAAVTPPKAYPRQPYTRQSLHKQT